MMRIGKKGNSDLPLAEDHGGSRCVGPASRRLPAAVVAAKTKKNQKESLYESSDLLTKP